MKLKKKHFKKLKEIAVAINRLDKLIADIESVQKLPVEDMIYAMHRKDVEANILKEGKAMVAASTDDGTEFNGGLREAAMEYYKKHYGINSNNGILEVEKGSETEKFLDSLMAPQIGDVGYFNLGSPNAPIVYGRIRNFTGNNYQDMHGNLYCGFSKTPPELK